MTELNKKSIRAIVTPLFKEWLNSPLEYADGSVKESDTIISRVQGDVDYIIKEEAKEREEDAEYEDYTLQQFRQAGVSLDKISDFISSFDNWDIEETAGDLTLEDYDAHESFEVNIGEHVGAYPEAIARAKDSGKEPVLAGLWLEQIADNYDIVILLNNEQTEVLSWALHQD